MALLNVPATKSSLLAMRAQLSFAEEGYILLDRKRELLLLELTEISGRAGKAREDARERLARAFAALREAELDSGSGAVDRAAPGAAPAQEVKLGERRLMGIRLPQAAAQEASGAVFGPGAPAGAGAAARAFSGTLPFLAALAGLEVSALRLKREQKKTQRRCNALSKKVIPDCRETLIYLSGALEEREREAFVVLKLVRNRLRVSPD